MQRSVSGVSSLEKVVAHLVEWQQRDREAQAEGEGESETTDGEEERVNKLYANLNLRTFDFPFVDYKQMFLALIRFYLLILQFTSVRLS